MENHSSPSASSLRQFNRRKLLNTVMLGAIVLMAVFLSWSKLLDQPAEDYINESIKNSGLIYASSRAINAAVSVAQSANLGIGVNVTIGELLDPVNDLIERFSAAMEIAITSLAMQKTLLLAVQHRLFDMLLTLLAIGLLLSHIFNWGADVWLKAFAILFVVRISLALVLLANYSADQLFLEEEIQAGKENIELFQKEASSFASSIGNSQADNKIETRKELDDAMSLQQAIKSTKANLEAQIQQLETRLSKEREKRFWWELDLWTDDLEYLQIKDQIEATELALETSEEKSNQISDKIDILKEKIECIEKHQQGETCSWSEKWGKITSKFDLSVLQASSAMNEKIDNLLSLMALIILKSIVFPVIFWFLLIKAAKTIWRKEYNIRPYS